MSQRKTIDISEPFLKVEDLCELLAVRPATVYGWNYKGGGPPATVVGGRLRWSRADVLEWLKTNNPTDDVSPTVVTRDGIAPRDDKPSPRAKPQSARRRPKPRRRPRPSDVKTQATKDEDS